MKTTLRLMLLLIVVLMIAVSAFAAPAKITFLNPSSAGQVNYTATCAIVGVLDKTDIVNDNAERINVTSLRTYSLSKGGQANYSTALNTKGSQFKINCVKTIDATDRPVKMFFDNISAFWMPVISGLFRFY